MRSLVLLVLAACGGPPPDKVAPSDTPDVEPTPSLTDTDTDAPTATTLPALACDDHPLCVPVEELGVVLPFQYPELFELSGDGAFDVVIATEAFTMPPIGGVFVDADQVVVAAGDGAGGSTAELLRFPGGNVGISYDARTDFVHVLTYSEQRSALIRRTDLAARLGG